MDARPVGVGRLAVPAAEGLEPERTNGAGLEVIDAELGRLQALPLADQIVAFAWMHQRLTDALAVTVGQGSAPSDEQRPR